MIQTQSYWETLPAQQINTAIAQLPISELHPLRDDATDELVEKKVGVYVRGKILSIRSTEYQAKQHSEAFRPAIEAITLRGIEDFEFSLWSTLRKASLAIYVGEAEDGVKFGFKITNSLDGSSAIKYRLNAYRRETTVSIVEKEHVLVWGYRQTCSNGMVIKIPLKTCKYLDAQKVTTLKTMLAMQANVIHRGAEIDSKLEKVQYMIEGFLLLKDPLNHMIIDAKNFELTPNQAKAFLMRYIGKRRLDKYMELYGQEEQTLWGLYNTITFYASHDDSLSSRIRERLLNGAGVMLTEELLATQEMPEQ